MEKLTFEKICQLITMYNLVENLFNDYIPEDIKKNLEFHGFKNYETVQYVCNSDEMYLTLHFKDVDIYVQLYGTYDSYGEYNHDYSSEIKQVFPKQKTITVYE